MYNLVLPADPSLSLPDAAEWYAAHGLAVIPLRPRDKVPLTPRGYLDATTDRDTVRSWWQADPEANVGGVPGSLDLVVVDIDGPEAEVGAASLGLFAEPTLAVRTGRERGLHLYFRRPVGLPKIWNATLANGVEVRCDSGYVVLPPSIHPLGVIYEWDRDELFPEPIELPPLVQLALAKRALASDRGKIQVAGSDPAAVATALRGPYQRAIPEGQRNDALFRHAAGLRNGGLDTDSIKAALDSVNRHQCVPPLPDHEVDQIARSASRYQPGGWQTQPSRRTIALVPGSGTRNLRLVSVDELLGRGARPWLVEGLIPCEAVVEIFGVPGAGKTFVALDLALAIAGGQASWHGRDLRSTGVVVYASPEGRLGMGCRITSWLQADAAVAPSVRQNLFFHENPLQVDRPDTADVLHTAALNASGGRKPVMFVIDTLAANMPGSTDTDAAAMGEAMAQFAKLARETGATVLFLHHSPLEKPARERGSGVIRGGVDVALKLTRRGSQLSLSTEKSRDSAASARLELELVEHGTSCIVRTAPPGNARVIADGAQTGAELNASELDVLNCLRDAGRTLSRREISTKVSGRMTLKALDKRLATLLRRGMIERVNRGEYCLAPSSANDTPQPPCPLPPLEGVGGEGECGECGPAESLVPAWEDGPEGGDIGVALA